ncbi:hypothetical protein GCM10010182_70480 [Actinomadura cremea]|nr:hypothetical protein GCM10010182_70480 [Actinomadura cremea]
MRFMWDYSRALARALRDASRRGRPTPTAPPGERWGPAEGPPAAAPDDRADQATDRGALRAARSEDRDGRRRSAHRPG